MAVSILTSIPCKYEDANRDLSSYLNRFEIPFYSKNHTENIVVQPIPTLSRLKQLVLIVQSCGDEYIMGFASLMKASPKLERLILQFHWSDVPVREMTEIPKPETCLHNSLKVAELEGYFGHARDLEAAIYILHNAVALEELKIDPRDQYHVNNYGYIIRSSKLDELIESEEAARKRAKEQLVGRVPSHVKLLIF